MNPHPDMVCRTCAEPLNSWHPFHDPDHIEWRHGGDPARDHPPAPTPSAETPVVHQICDFCSDTGVRWIYHTKTEISIITAQPTYTGNQERHRINRHYEHVTPEEGTPIDQRHDVFSTGWAACDDCADYVEVRDVEGLITRLRRHQPDIFATRSRTILRRLYQPLFRSIRGRYRVNPTTGHELPDENPPT